MQVRERTLEPGVNTRVAGLDLGHGDRFPEHAMDKGWLDLDGSDDALTVAKHCIAQRRKGRGHVEEWPADHPSWVTSGVNLRPQAVGEQHDDSSEGGLRVGEDGHGKKDVLVRVRRKVFMWSSHVLRLAWPGFKLGQPGRDDAARPRRALACPSGGRWAGRVGHATTRSCEGLRIRAK